MSLLDYHQPFPESVSYAYLRIHPLAALLNKLELSLLKTEMPKRKRNKSRKGHAGPKRRDQAIPMTPEKIQRIENTVQRMTLDLTRAIQACGEHRRDILDEDRHEFWALVKYVENVQDGIVQLDNINKTIFPKLIEFPQTSDHDTETSWQSLKGMRSRLAHAFDHIDHEILWSTVTIDFPILGSLLKVIHFFLLDHGQVRVGFKAGLWRTLPKVHQGETLGAGNSIPCIMFKGNGDAVCVRIGRIADDKITIRTSKGSFQVREIALVDPDDNNSIERLWPPARATLIDRRVRAHTRCDGNPPDSDQII